MTKEQIHLGIRLLLFWYINILRFTDYKHSIPIDKVGNK